MKVKSESELAQSCPTLATPWTAAYQAPPSMGFSRQKYWREINQKWPMLSEVAQLCPTLCDPVDCSPPGSSIHGTLQARILEWVAISFSRVSSRPGDQTLVSRIVGRLYQLSHQESQNNHILLFHFVYLLLVNTCVHNSYSGT